MDPQIACMSSSMFRSTCMINTIIHISSITIFIKVYSSTTYFKTMFIYTMQAYMPYANTTSRAQNSVMGYPAKKDADIYLSELGVLLYTCIYFLKNELRGLNVYGQYINLLKDKDYI